MISISLIALINVALNFIVCARVHVPVKWAGEEAQVRGKAVESGSKYGWAGEEGQVWEKAV